MHTGPIELARHALFLKEHGSEIGVEFQPLVNDLSAKLSSTQHDNNGILSIARDLWRANVQFVQRDNLDDRSLYWSRIAMLKMLNQSKYVGLAQKFEDLSRNVVPVSTSNPPQVILAGFDPFSLDRHLDQSNPSGVFVLSLHGREIAGLRVHSMMFPVRYSDFDEGCVERAFSPYLRSSSTRLVVTVSMGRDGFDFERFPGKCRNSEALDNENVCILNREKRFEPPLDDAPDYFEYTLPVDTLGSHNSPTFPVRVTDNRTVVTEEHGRELIQDLAELEGRHAVEGSGGSFLSNEIAYRTLRLRTKLDADIPMGHLHVPRFAGFDREQITRDLAIFRELLLYIRTQIPD